LKRTTWLVLILLCVPAVVLAQDKFFDSAGVTIRFVDQGAGEAIVLLHGQGNTLDTLWMRPGRLEQFGLASGYRVIAFDARGHGKSGKPHDPNLFGREMALDVVRLMDHLQIGRAHVIGYSMGAMTVAQLLTLRPERFLSAVQIAGAGSFQWTPQDERAVEQEAIEIERDCVSRTAILAGVQLNDSPPTDADIKARSKTCFENATQDRFAMAALVRGRRSRVIAPAEIATVDVPTLGVVGSLDPLAAGMRELKKLRPDMTFVVVEGATHGSPTDTRSILQQPQAISAIREFIAAHHSATSR
jgi:pimeloyl-ACP methyl ester carboxylesterase